MINIRKEVLKMRYLEPKFENVKSYYKKAVIQKIFYGNDYSYKLISYDTVVCKVSFDDKMNKNVYIYNLESSTTMRHVKEFLRQLGYPKMTKQELIDLSLCKNITL